MEMDEPYENCTLCPRNCRVNRLQGERGYCGEGARMRAAWAGLHLGEEPALLGTKGSGTVFFAGCTLKCDYCQNCQLSRRGLGRELSPGELQLLMLRLQQRGAANINLVTASHFAPAIVESVAAAREAGLSIPVVWNSSGYERLSTLELLGRTVDIHLPDCKTLDGRLSRRLMGASDYPEVAREALAKMVEDKPLIVEKGQIRQGVILRHLVLPGFLPQSRQVLEWFALNMKERALLSLMLQYTPVRPEAGGVQGAGSQTSEAFAPRPTASPRAGSRPVRAETAVPSRAVNRREYGQVLSWLEELGIDDGFLQEPARTDDWLPDFARPNPFPPGQAEPLWHFAKGYLD
jgi:putative pyruvate formate lyase activating enzyme